MHLCTPMHICALTYWPLSLGIVPALFAEEEKDNILSLVGQEAMKQGSGPAKESVWQYFVNKSANNLHVVLGMSPVGDTLRTRCRNFPGNPGATTAREGGTGEPCVR